MILLQLVRALNFDLHFSNVRTNAYYCKSKRTNHACASLSFSFFL